MAESIRMLHFADTHIGMENYGRIDSATGMNTRVLDFLHRMDEMYDYARAHEVDLIVFAGDAFKTRTPTPTQQTQFAHRMRELSELAPVVMIVGNHDLPPSEAKASTIDIYTALAVPNVWVSEGFETRVIPTRRGSVFVGTAPYPMRGRALEAFDTGNRTIAETDELVASVLATQLDEMAQEAARHAMPRVLVGHFSVAGAMFSSERQVMLGRDVQILPSVVADPRWDYVALGHIHKHQDLTRSRTDAPPVVYCGSLERIDFGEEGDTKGFCWVNLARAETTYTFVPVQARPFVTLSYDARDLHEPTPLLVELIESHDLTDAVVRMRLTLTPEGESRVHEPMLRDAIRRRGAFMIAGISKVVERPERTRLGSGAEELTDAELLHRYLLMKQVEPARREALQKLADQIMEQTHAARTAGLA
jgi:exonuclease SbcD